MRFGTISLALVLIAGTAAAQEAPYYGPMKAWHGIGYRYGYSDRITKDGSWRIVVTSRSGEPVDMAMYRAAERARDEGYPYVQFLGGSTVRSAAYREADIRARPSAVTRTAGNVQGQTPSRLLHRRCRRGATRSGRTRWRHARRRHRRSCRCVRTHGDGLWLWHRRSVADPSRGSDRSAGRASACIADHRYAPHPGHALCRGAPCRPTGEWARYVAGVVGQRLIVGGRALR